VAQGWGELGDLLGVRLVDQDELEGFLGEVAAGDEPFVVLLDQEGTGQPQQGGVVGEDPDHVGAPADLAVDPLQRVGSWYERPWMPPVPTDRLLVVAGGLRSTVRPSGTGASGSKRRLGRPVIVRWAASPS
jgi:hypothetical protein